MAKDKEKTEDKKSSKINTKKMIVIGIVFLITTFICTFMGVSFILNKNNSKEMNKNVEDQKVIETEQVSLGEDFVVNLSEIGTKRYIKANVTLAYNLADKDFSKNLDKNVVVLRDTTISYLKGRTEEQLKDLDALKSELVKELNKKLNVENTITDAYFQNFLIQ